MKKIILSTMVLAIAATTVNAQDKKKTNDGGAYLRVGAGYSLPQAGGYIGGTETSTATSYSVDMTKGSYSSGVNAVLAGGYMFTRNIGVEVAVGAGVAPTKYTYEYDQTGSGNYKNTSTTYAKMPIMVMPSLVLSTGHNQLEAYTRVGLAINVAGKFISENEYVDRSGATDVITTTTEEYTPKLGIGIQGAVGVKYHVNDMLGIYLELNGLSMTSYMKNSEITSYEVGGVSGLGTLTIYDRETEYSANFTETAASTSASTPFKSTPMSVPFSNLGVGVGITLKF
jgi:outer membrane protein W